MMQKISTLIVLLALGLGAHAETVDTASTKALSGTMIPASFKAKLSAEGLKNMDIARAKLLMSDANEEVSWTDGKKDFSGSFSITNRYSVKSSGERCREYIHILKNRAGQPVPSETTGRPFKVRDIVCFQNSTWVKYQGDRSLLVPESKSDKPAPSGPTGPEHRREFPNMVGPQAMGQILDGFKLFRKAIEDQSTEDLKNQVREQMYKWSQDLATQMSTNKKTMALDQVTILLAEVRKDSVKFKVLETLRPSLDVKVGDLGKVTELFLSAGKKSEVEKLLKP